MAKIIISGPLVIWKWVTPHFNQKLHFSVAIYKSKESQVEQKWLDWIFILLKVDTPGLNLYLKISLRVTIHH